MPDKSTNGVHEIVNRRRFLTGVGAVGVTGLSGCLGGGGDGNSGNNGATTGDSGSSEWADLSGNEIHFINSDNSDLSQEFWTEVASAFEEDTGVTFELEFTGIGTSHEQRVTQLLQAGDPPELDWITPEYASTAGYNGVLADLSEAIDYARDQLGEPLEQGRVVMDGEDQLFPGATAYGLLWYRRDLPSAPDEPPTTWDDFQAYVEETAQLDSPGNGVYIPTGQGAHAMSHHWSWALSNDATVCTRTDGEVICNIAEGSNRDRWVELLDYLNTLHEYSPIGTDSSWTALTEAIQNETVASNWYSGVRPKNAASRAGAPFAEDVDVVAGLPTNNGELTRAGGNGIGSFEGADTEAAVEFLKWFSTPSEDRPDIRDVPFAFSPMQNVLAWPEQVDSDWYFERSVESTGSAWTEEQINRILYDVGDTLNFVNETDPPNPFGGAIYSSNAVQDMVAEACIDDTDPEQLVDQYQETINNVIQNAQ